MELRQKLSLASLVSDMQSYILVSSLQYAQRTLGIVTGPTKLSS